MLHLALIDQHERQTSQRRNNAGRATTSASGCEPAFCNVVGVVVGFSSPGARLPNVRRRGVAFTFTSFVDERLSFGFAGTTGVCPYTETEDYVLLFDGHGLYASAS